MPWKPLTPEQPSFYLDQSTLSDAYKSLRLEASARDREYLPLVAWVQRIARDANLCVGWPHVYELAAWKGPDPDAMAHWLDDLPLVWVNQTAQVIRSEVVCGLRREAGQEPASPAPFAPSYLATYESLPFDALCDALGRTSLPEIVRMARLHSPTKWREQSWKYAQMLHSDRKQSALHPNFARQLLDARERERLRRELNELLGAIEDGVQGGLARPPAKVVSGTLKRMHEIPREFRCYHTSRLLGFAFADRSAHVAPGTKKFREMGSSALDIEHATAAASYCDVFTCDKLTSDWLGDVRVQRYGLKAQLARRNFASTTDFIDALIATAP